MQRKMEMIGIREVTKLEFNFFVHHFLSEKGNGNE